MPWEIKEKDGKYSVCRSITRPNPGAVVQSYDGNGAEARAENLVAALLASEPEAGDGKSADQPEPTNGLGVMAVKSLGETDDAYIIGGYGMRWGSPEERDLTRRKNADGSKGEFFTPETAGMDDIPVKVLTHEHDMDKDDDGKPIKEIIGHVILERDQKIGRWIEARVDRARQYADHVMGLVAEGVLSFSSETASHWREVAANGEIKRWRTAGYTTTTGPMEPRQTDVSQLKAAFKSAAIDFPDDQPDSDKPDDGGAGTGVPGQDQLQLEAAKASIEIMLSQIDIELEV